jgi:hypothetical protein
MKPFKDRFELSITSSIVGVPTTVPTMKVIEQRITGSTTASLMPQSFKHRQGISVRTSNQYYKTTVRPVIYAGNMRSSDRDTDVVDIHEINVNDYGVTEPFDEIGPFKDFSAIIAKDFIENSDIVEYPQIYFDPAAVSPSNINGIIEPLTIREAMLNGIESPFAARRVHAEFMDGNINPDPSYGTDRIVQFIPLTSSISVDPYIDSIETRLPAESGSIIHRMVVPGIVSDIKRLDTPFDDSRIAPYRMLYTFTASMSDRGIIDYLKKSSGAGYTYMNNPEGTDSVVYGGNFKSGSLGTGSYTLNSGFISFTPPRVRLRKLDSQTGSYPTILRTTGRENTLGNYATSFNDINTIIFANDVNCSYPDVLHVGSRFLSDYTSSIEATGVVRKGVSDSNYDIPVVGINITPFDESRVNLQTGSFYTTGTLPSILPGFSDSLWDKTQIVLDIQNSENCDVYVATASSDNWRTPNQGRVTNGIGTGLAYYNFTKKKWEMHFHPGSSQITGSHSMFNSPDPQIATGSMQTVSIPQDLESSAVGDGGLSDIDQRAGRIAGHAGFPFDQKFNATGSQLLEMSDYIQHPFLVEKLVYEFSASWGAEEQPENGGIFRAGKPFYSTFAVIRQSRKGIYEIITSSLTSATGSGSPQLHDSTYIATRRRDIISFADVAWTTSVVSTASYFYDADAAKSFPELVRDITLIPGFEGSESDVSGRLTGSYKLEFEARTPVIADDLGLPLGYNGGPSSIYSGVTYADSGSIVAGAAGAYNQHNKGGGRTGTATYGTFMGDGRSPSGGVTGTQLSGSFLVALQGLSDIRQIVVSGNYKEPSPYILMPEDSLCLTWINQNMSGNLGFQPSINMRLPVGRGKLTLYGSLIRDSVGVHDNTNQYLTSDVISEHIHEIVVDQFQVESREEHFETYLDRYVTGSMTGNVPGNWRAVVGSFVSGTARSSLDSGIVGAPMLGMSGSFQRFVRMADTSERFYDTLLPDFTEYGIRAGAVSANKGEKFPRSTDVSTAKGTMLWWGATPEGDTDTANPTFYREANSDRMPFPYLHNRKRFDQQRAVNISAQPSSGSVSGANEAIFPKNETAKILFGVGWTFFGQDTFGNQFKMSHANTGSARGYRYGILDINKIHSSMVYRSDKYGQFRDILEQRTNAKYYTEKEVQESPVLIKFVESGTTTPTLPLNTTCQNLSFEYTSSLPYFDGKAVDRLDNPFEKEQSVIALGVNTTK